MNASDGSDQINLSNHQGIDDESNFSPDGSSIAFVSERKDDRGDIYVMRSSGSKQKRLTDGRHTDERPAFSPDGKQITYARDARIVRMQSDGSNKKVVYDGGPRSTSNEPDWGAATGA